jgi:hypothetical protein
MAIRSLETVAPEISWLSPTDQMDWLSEFRIDQAGLSVHPRLPIQSVNADALPSERRIRFPSCDRSTIYAGASCPFCAVMFKVSAGFISHLIVEHWCEREFALASWLTFVPDRPKKQTIFLPIQLEIH